MKNPDNKSEKESLRQRAEALLKMKPSKTASPLSETEMKELIYELEVHQAELEIQNEELEQAKSTALNSSGISVRQKNLMMEAAQEGILGLDTAGCHTFVNPMALEILGYGMEEFLGKNLHELIHHHHRDGRSYRKEDCPICNALQNGKPASGEEYFWKKDGSGFPAGFNCLPIIEKYQNTGAVVTFFDVSDQKRAEEDARKANEVLAATLDALPDVFFNVGLDGYCYDFHSPRAGLVNKSARDIIGHTIQSLLPPKISHVVMSAIKEANEKGFSIGKQFEMKVHSGNYWFELSVSRKVSSPDGPPHFIILRRDITQRKMDYDALRRSEAKLAKLVSNMGDVIVIIDKDGINRYTSPNIEKWFGWKPQDTVGASTWENIHPEDLAATRKFIDEMMEKPEAVGPSEFRHRCKDGSYKLIQIKVVNLLEDPDIQGLVGMYHEFKKDA